MAQCENTSLKTKLYHLNYSLNISTSVAFLPLTWQRALDPHSLEGHWSGLSQQMCKTSYAGVELHNAPSLMDSHLVVTENQDSAGRDVAHAPMSRLRLEPSL